MRGCHVPLFVFVITMENHGPLDLERIDRKEEAHAFTISAPPSGCEDLTTYLRHLANADRMIGRLRARLNLFPEAWLCLFGDHVPIMPEVYRQLGECPMAQPIMCFGVPGRSAGAPTSVDLDVDQLGVELLRRMACL